MLRSIRLLACAVFLLAAGTVHAQAPDSVRISLQRGDLPAGSSLLRSMTAFYPPSKLNGDTVPYGLSVKGLHAAGFRGLYVESISLPHDNNPYGYSWQYLEFGTSSAAHHIYSGWVHTFKYPFDEAKGHAGVCSEDTMYEVVAVSPAQAALLCRSGRFVVLGHWTTASGVKALMRRVAARTR